MFMNCWYDSKMFGLSGDRSFYKNDKVDQLIRQAVEVTDQKQRTDLYRQAQKIVVDEAGYILLFQTSTIVPQRANVKGFVYNPMLDGMFNFEDMSKS
jgi:peptide/nickel transport system substrate-binding protein